MMGGSLIGPFQSEKRNVNKKDRFNQGVCTYLPPRADGRANLPAFVSSGGHYEDPLDL